MNRKALHLALSACLVMLAVAIATDGFGAFAASSTKPIKGCVKKKGRNKGLLRIAKKCKRTERRITWNARGPRGRTGRPGPQGVAGAQGPKGDTGPAGVDAVAPSGAVMFFDKTTCPLGWSAFTPARGRYLVGIPENGTLDAQVGTALGDQENRAVGRHQHAVFDPGHTHTVPYDTDRLENLGNTIGGTRRFGVDSATATTSVATTGISIGFTGTTPGTNAPYVQLLACRKD